MAEIIDLTEILRRKKFVRYLTKGIGLDLSEDLIEEFKFRLEGFLCENLNVFTKQNYEREDFNVDEIEIFENEGDENTLMTIAFIDGVLTFLMPDEVTEEHYSKFGSIAISVIIFWEEFEKNIFFISQDLD